MAVMQQKMQSEHSQGAPTSRKHAENTKHTQKTQENTKKTQNKHKHPLNANTRKHKKNTKKTQRKYEKTCRNDKTSQKAPKYDETHVFALKCMFRHTFQGRKHFFHWFYLSEPIGNMFFMVSAGRKPFQPGGNRSEGFRPVSVSRKRLLWKSSRNINSR